MTSKRCASTLSAAAVITGDGDDTLINNGVIEAYVFTNGVGSSTTAIDLGTGNDALTLSDGSSVIGSITLGEGDDSLTLIGVPLVAETGTTAFTLPAGNGVDTLMLVGEGAFAATLTGFEHAFKSEAGTYTLPGLASLDSLTIDLGELALLSAYDFDTNGQYFSYFHTDGDAGLFSIDGTSILDGAISIEKRGNTFVSDDSRYTIVSTTGGVSNAFADITLP